MSISLHLASVWMFHYRKVGVTYLYSVYQFIECVLYALSVNVCLLLKWSGILVI